MRKALEMEQCGKGWCVMERESYTRTLPTRIRQNSGQLKDMCNTIDGKTQYAKYIKESSREESEQCLRK